MREPEDLDPPVQKLAAALGALEPEPLRLRPEQIWYRAGFEAGRRRANVWRGVAAAAAVALAGSLFVPLGRRPEPVVVERVVHAPPSAAVSVPMAVDPPPPPASHGPVAFSSATSLRLRELVLEEGWTALPPSRGVGDAAERPLRAWPAGSADDALLPPSTHLPNTRG